MEAWWKESSSTLCTKKSVSKATSVTSVNEGENLSSNIPLHAGAFFLTLEHEPVRASAGNHRTEGDLFCVRVCLLR
jgi:hypothetical protein